MSKMSLFRFPAAVQSKTEVKTFEITKLPYALYTGYVKANNVWVSTNREKREICENFYQGEKKKNGNFAM